MQSGASNVATLLVGRIIGGLAIGYVGLSLPLPSCSIRNQLVLYGIGCYQ